MLAVTYYNLKRQREKRDDARFLLKLEILKSRVASLTPSCCGHLSLSTTAALPIFQLIVIKQTWVLSSSHCSCLVALFQVNIISCSFNFFSLSLCLMLGVEACLQAGKWMPETEHEAGEGPQRSRINRCSLVNEKHTNKHMIDKYRLSRLCVLGRNAFCQAVTHGYCSAAESAIKSTPLDVFIIFWFELWFMV